MTIKIKNPDTGASIEITPEIADEIRTKLVRADDLERDDILFAGMLLNVSQARAILAAIPQDAKFFEKRFPAELTEKSAGGAS